MKKGILLKLLVLTIVTTLTACASAKSMWSKLTAAVDETNEPAYSMGSVMQEETQMQNAYSRGNNMHKNNNDASYQWVPPMVQKVQVPPTIKGGVFMPAHETYVIVKDGAYVMDTSRTDMLRVKYNLPQHVEISSPLNGTDVVVAIFRLNKLFDEARVVDIPKISFLLDKKSMERALALSNEEITQVGNHVLSFNREKGGDYMEAKVVAGGLKQISTYNIERGQVLVLPDGHVLAPVFEKKKKKGA